MITVYRICKQRVSNDLTGKGAEKVGGRWNSKGVAVVYVSPGIAICTAEVAVHLPLGIIPQDYTLVTIQVPDVPVKEIPDDRLPSDWRLFPAPASTMTLGDEFVKEGKYLLMKVPSAAVPGEFNYIINPAHPDAKKITIKDVKPYEFDKRLFDR